MQGLGCSGNGMRILIWQMMCGNANTSGQSYKHFMLVNYNSRVVIWGIFQSGTNLES